MTGCWRDAAMRSGRKGDCGPTSGVLMVRGERPGVRLAIIFVNGGDGANSSLPSPPSGITFIPGRFGVALEGGDSQGEGSGDASLALTSCDSVSSHLL